MRVLPATVVAGVLFIFVSAAEWRSAWAAGQGTSTCVAIGKPSPSATYTYEHVESTGNRSQYTERWEEVTDVGSRVRTTRAASTVMIQVNEHHIVDDVSAIDRSTKRNPSGMVVESTTFRPGIIADPAFRACAGRSWPIPSVTAAYEGGGNRAAAATPAGMLRIVAIREALTVPAGKFDTVHYIRTSQSKDEYWKSIDHGVIVKHIGTLPGVVITDTLISIK